MSGFLAIFRRELAALLRSSLGLFCLPLFYATAAFIFFFKAPPWTFNHADLGPGFFGYGPIYLLVLTPLFAMRAWADESRGALELLLTLPLRTADIVLGKFAAQTVYLWLLLLTTLPLPLSLAFLGAPDWAAIGAGYLALALLTALFAAIGLFCVAYHESPIIGAIVSFIVCFLLYALGLPAWLEALPPNLATLSAALSVLGPFTEIAAGRLSLPGACYFLTVILFFLALCTLRLQLIKWASLLSATARRYTLPALSAFFVLTLAAYGLNLVFRTLRYDYIDLTANRQYTLSPETEKTLATLPHLITVRAFINVEPAFDQAAGIQYARALLSRYRDAAHGNIDLQFIDPNTAGDKKDDPLLNLAAHYGIPFDIRESTKTGGTTRERAFHAVQVQYADRGEVFQFDPADPGSLEAQLTVAIRGVVQETPPKVLLWENVAGARHMPRADPDQLPGASEALYILLRQSHRYEIAWQDFSQSIPADTRLILLHDPKDMPANDVYALQEFVRAGGAVVIATGAYGTPAFPEARMLQRLLPATADRKQTGLESLLDGWGLRLGDGLVVDRAALRPQLLPSRDNGHTPSPVVPWPLLLNLTGDSLNPAAPFTAGFQRLHLNFASPIDVATQPPDGLQFQWLIRSTPEARLLTGNPVPVQPMNPALALDKPGDGRRFVLGVYGHGVFPAVLPPPAGTPASAPAGEPRHGHVVLIGAASFLHESWDLHPKGYEPVDYSPGKPNGLQLYTVQLIHRLAGAQDLLTLQAKQNVARPLSRYSALPPEERTAAYGRVAWIVLLAPTCLWALVAGLYLQRRRARSSRSLSATPSKPDQAAPAAGGAP